MFLADKTDNNYLDCSYGKNDKEPRHALAGNLADCLGLITLIPELNGLELILAVLAIAAGVLIFLDR